MHTPRWKVLDFFYEPAKGTVCILYSYQILQICLIYGNSVSILGIYTVSITGLAVV